MLENSRIRLDLLMMETIVFGRGFGLKVHNQVFTDTPSDARDCARFAHKTGNRPQISKDKTIQKRRGVLPLF
jgi:hypothetical protein